VTERGGLLLPATALLGVAATAVVAWSGLVDGLVVSVIPVAALAAPALAATRPGPRAAAALAVWVLAAPVLAGVPTDQLEPAAWTALPGRLGDGVATLADMRGAMGGSDPWPLAVGLLLAGAAWIAAAALARRRPGPAFLAAVAPWLAAVLLHPGHTTVWQGAAVVLAGLLWHAWPRSPGRAAVVLSVAVALVSAIGAQAVAPRHRWFRLPGSDPPSQTPFGFLETEPTFGRLTGRRTGAPMLDITAGQPAFWRLQVLDVFDGHGWRTSRAVPRLPEPAARPVRIYVRVRGLGNELVASPGAIERVRGPGSAEPAPGSAWRLGPGPQAGDEYQVDARVVEASADQLRRAGPPRVPGVEASTLLGWKRDGPRQPPILHVGPFSLSLKGSNAEPRGFPIDVPPFGTPGAAEATAALDRSPYGAVAALARRLASGAGSEWQVVARVMSYLRDERRFRYTTDVGTPGPFPLADFLLRTHAGYCQHFAGAAALLLRLAGVPTRLVAGFAPGVRSRGRFEVRDTDAHDWIEVYFAGYGWVPFNPTPAVAPAAIPPALDLLAPAAPRPRLLGWPAWTIVGLLAAAGVASRRRRRPPELGDVLGRLVGTPLLPSTTLGALGAELARTVGPHTAALAAEAEQARFTAAGAVPRRWPRARVARAVARDVGPWRAALLLTGAGPAGARSSPPPGPRDIA
jgi:hypothetical protein